MLKDNNGFGDRASTRLPEIGSDRLRRSSEQVANLVEGLRHPPVPLASEWSGRDATTAIARSIVAELTAVEDDAQTLASAGRIAEQILAAARERAEAMARELIAAAVGAAEEIRAVARRDAEDIIAAARARMREERVFAEARAAERLDAAEHKALEIVRNAWKLAQMDTEQRTGGATTMTATRET